MTIFEAVIQGIIQGLTEFLPVSSSGHLALAAHFFGMSGEETVTLAVVLHLGTLAAVFAAFFEKIKSLIIEAFYMLRDIFTGRFKLKEMNQKRRMIVMLIISVLPLFVFYPFRDFFEGLVSNIIVIGIAFLYTSALLFISTKTKEGKKLAGEATLKDALLIGFFQGIALVPGISRSGSTISAGLLSGLKRTEAVEYSFILGIPVILAGALVHIRDIGGSDTALNIPALCIGFIIAAAVGYLSIGLIKYLIVSDKFRVFAYYTLFLGIATVCIGLYDILF